MRAHRYRVAEAELNRALAQLNAWKAQLPRLSGGASLLNPVPFVGPEPDVTKIRKAFDDYLQARSGRPGPVRDQLDQWGETLTTDWHSLPPNLKRPIVTDLISTRVTKDCGVRGSDNPELGRLRLQDVDQDPGDSSGGRAGRAGPPSASTRSRRCSRAARFS